MKNIYDIVTADNVAGFYEAQVEGDNQPIGELLFPRKKQLGLELSFIKGKGGLPVVLKPSAFDVRSPLRDRVGMETLKTDMPFFKESMLVKEKDRQDLLTMLQTNNDQYINMITTRIFEDEATLLAGAQSQEERLRMQLLTQGKIAISDNGVDREYDYGMPEANRLFPAKAWSDKSANVGKDIIGWMMDARRSGKPVSRVLSNTSTISNIMDNTSISKEILSNQGGSGVVTPSMVGQYLQSKFNLTLLVNDNVFIDENGDTKQYVADGVFTLLPDGPVGQTVFGTTPEEADLMSGATSAEVAIVNLGVAVTTMKKEDPVNVETKVSMITLPSFEAIDNVFIADVSKTE